MEAIEQIKQAFHRDDAPAVRELLDRNPALKARIDEPVGGLDSPAILNVRSPQMLDVLLDAGADINARSRWWAGGFGLLHSADPKLAAYAVQRGAIVDVHAAARLGLFDRLKELITADPALVHARGGDGQTPLHFASTVEIANYLLDHGADIDARDVDHESTPAQYMIRSRQPVARFLVSRGCTTDLLMAAALGDLDLARKHLTACPDSIRMRVSDDYFPMVGSRAGGSIYQWELGWYVSAHQVARNFGHEALLQWLMQQSPDEIKLTAACWLKDAAAVQSLLAADPRLADRLPASERRQLAHAARNNDLEAARLMLSAGLPLDATGQHGATPLHWAAFHGNLELINLLLPHHPPLELNDRDFNATPLGWAIHGSEHGWDRAKGDFPGSVKALLSAGAKPPADYSGTPEVRAVLAAHA